MSPRGRRQNPESREHRRSEILQNAVPLFVENGFSATTMSAVAQAASVSHGTIFLYFPTKEALFEAAVLEKLEEVVLGFCTDMEREGAPCEKIRSMVTRQIREFAEQEPYLRLTQYAVGQRARFPQLAERIFNTTERFQIALANVILEGQTTGDIKPGDAMAMAWAYFAFLNGVVLTIATPQGYPIWEHMTDFALHIFGL